MAMAVSIDAGVAVDSRLIGDSASFQEVVARIARFSACDAPVLIEGETGTSKELVARRCTIAPRAGAIRSSRSTARRCPSSSWSASCSATSGALSRVPRPAGSDWWSRRGAEIY